MNRLRKNKNGFIGDVVTGSFQLLILFMVFALCFFIAFQFNQGLVENDNVPQEAKDINTEVVYKYSHILGYGFPLLLVCLFVYTIVTASMVDVISKVWFVVGVILMIGQAVISYVIREVFLKLIEVEIFSQSLVLIPFAASYFSNIILYNCIWGFIILTVLYVKEA